MIGGVGGCAGLHISAPYLNSSEGKQNIWNLVRSSAATFILNNRFLQHFLTHLHQFSQCFCGIEQGLKYTSGCYAGCVTVCKIAEVAFRLRI